MPARYIAPNNTKTDNPALAFIEDRLLNGGPAYWKTQSCTAGIEDVESGNWLILMVEPGVGVYVRFSASGDDEFVLIDPGITEGGELTLYPGGDEMRVPRAQVVQPELALQAVRRFLETGDRLAQAQWVIVGT